MLFIWCRAVQSLRADKRIAPHFFVIVKPFLERDGLLSEMKNFTRIPYEAPSSWAIKLKVEGFLCQSPGGGGEPIGGGGEADPFGLSPFGPGLI